MKNALDMVISGNGEGNDFGYREGALAIGQTKSGRNARTVKMTTAKTGTKPFNKTARE